MPRDELASRLDRLAAPADATPPPGVFLARVTRRRWARRARVGLPAAAALLVVGLVAFQLLHAREVTDGARPSIHDLPQAAVTPRPDSLAALRDWDGTAELVPAHAAPASLHTPRVREPALRALDGYRARASAPGSDEPR